MRTSEDWLRISRREAERYRDGEKRLPKDASDERQRALTRLGNAAWGAGLAALMQGDATDARTWFDRASVRYRDSYDLAPPHSWGRPVAVLKTRILAGDWNAAEDAAEWTLGEGAAETESPIGRYAGALALLVLGRDVEAREVAGTLRDRDDFPPATADALATIAAADRAGYLLAVEDVLESFETRDEYLEDVPVADTVIVLQALAARRDVAVDLPPSPVLPPR